MKQSHGKRLASPSFAFTRTDHTTDNKDILTPLNSLTSTTPVSLSRVCRRPNRVFLSISLLSPFIHCLLRLFKACLKSIFFFLSLSFLWRELGISPEKLRWLAGNSIDPGESFGGAEGKVSEQNLKGKSMKV